MPSKSQSLSRRIIGNARGITVDTNGNVYVVDNYANVVKFDSDGTLLKTWATLGVGFDVAADANGNIYVAEGGYMGPARASKFSSEGTPIARWGEGLLDDPRGIAVDATGNSIYVSDEYGGFVRKFMFRPTAVQSRTWSAVKSLYRRQVGWD